jgi:hypothetical protein
MSRRDIVRTQIAAEADEVRSIADGLERLARDLEDSQPDEDAVELPFRNVKGTARVALDVTQASDALEDATRIILAYYNICRDLGHTTPVMTDAREFLRQYAPQEVW